MDTEIRRLKRAGSSANKDDPEIDYRGYTSLKDVLTRSISNCHVTSNDDNQFINSSNISIKNVLVKHAASAYVQSAFLAQRDPTSCGSVWYNYVTKPLDACFHVVFQFFRCLIDGIVRLRRDRITISWGPNESILVFGFSSWWFGDFWSLTLYIRLLYIWSLMYYILNVSWNLLALKVSMFGIYAVKFVYALAMQAL